MLDNKPGNQSAHMRGLCDVITSPIVGVSRSVILVGPAYIQNILTCLRLPEKMQWNAPSQPPT